LARIAEALEQSRFTLFAQDIRPISDASLEASHEILLRLIDRDGYLIAPMNFIPAAERYGLMLRLDRWVIERTIREVSAHSAVLRRSKADSVAASRGRKRAGPKLIRTDGEWQAADWRQSTDT